MELFYFSRSAYQIVRKCLQNGQHEASTKTYQQLSNKKKKHVMELEKGKKEAGELIACSLQPGVCAVLATNRF